MTSNHFIAVAAVLGVAYIVLGLLCLAHVQEEGRKLLSRRWAVFFFWWPIYGDMYKESASKLRVVGGVTLVLLVAVWVMWYVMPS